MKGRTVSYDRTVRLDTTDFPAAVTAVRDALAAQGFGVITEIDMAACNVVVRRADDHVLVQAVDPAMMVRLSDAEGLRSVAEEATTRLDTALAALV